MYINIAQTTIPETNRICYKYITTVNLKLVSIKCCSGILVDNSANLSAATWYLPWLQKSPPHPSMQLHCHGFVHVPFLHPGYLMHSLHREPSQPIRHLKRINAKVKTIRTCHMTKTVNSRMPKSKTRFDVILHLFIYNLKTTPFCLLFGDYLLPTIVSWMVSNLMMAEFESQRQLRAPSCLLHTKQICSYHIVCARSCPKLETLSCVVYWMPLTKGVLHLLSHFVEFSPAASRPSVHCRRIENCWFWYKLRLYSCSKKFIMSMPLCPVVTNSTLWTRDLCGLTSKTLLCKRRHSRVPLE